MKVVIVGPNLPKQAKATFHVHVVGCADLRRGWLCRARADTVNVESRHDVEKCMYDYAADEDEDYVLGDYQDEFYFAPCLDDLPLEGS